MDPLKVDLVSYCCGAKLIYGFPDEWPVRKYEGPEYQNRCRKVNEKNSAEVKKQLISFFTNGFKAKAVDGREYSYTEENNLTKNAFVYAITNNIKDPLIGPILQEFGFKPISAERNPNSGSMIYFYLWNRSEALAITNKVINESRGIS